MQFLPRLFSTLLILLAIGVAAMWIMGGKKKDNQTSMEFDVPPEQIFPYLTEPERIREWFSGLVSIDPINVDAEGDNRSDRTAVTNQRVLQDASGNKTTYADSVLRYTPNRMLSIKSRSDHGDTTWIYQLEPRDDNRTKVTFRVVKSASGLSRLFAPLQQDVALKQIEVDIRHLKEAAERSPAITATPTSVDSWDSSDTNAATDAQAVGN